MTTLGRLLIQLSEIPMATAWYLADLAEAKGRQLLYTRQGSSGSPQSFTRTRSICSTRGGNRL